MSKKDNKLAIIYDFDYTLSPMYMHDFSFIPGLRMCPYDYWKEKDEFTLNTKMDGILASMFFMLKKAKEKNICINKSFLENTGKNIEFYPGVKNWFSNISTFGKDFDVTVEHYIVSSGLKEIINGTSIAKNFKEIFASEFFYDEAGSAVWPLTSINYTNKTQFIFRINKGILNTCNDVDLNKSTPESEKPIPFKNMVYIGDGLTDVACMKVMQIYGGTSIAVYGKSDKVAKELLHFKRADYIFPADYTKGSKLDIKIRDIIKETSKRALR